MTKQLNLFLALIIFFGITIFSPMILAVEPIDISNHWAQDYILNLVNNDIMKLYSDKSFKPDQSITRGEFAIALTKQMSLLPDHNTNFSDLQGYPDFSLVNSLVEKGIINGYPNGTFKPNQPITKAEVVAIMIKALGINNNEVIIKLEDYNPFKDLPDNHWAFNHIKIAEKLNLIEADNDDNFYPTKEISRAEAAKYLIKLSHLSSDIGYLTDVYPSSRKVSINLLQGERKVLNYDQQTLVARNNRLVELDEILKTDKVFIITEKEEDVKYIKAYGMVTQEDLAQEVSTMTNGIFAPEEVKKLSSGDIEFLKPKLQTAIRDQLNSQGLTPDEVTSIMSTDWDKLEDLSKTRLSEAIAIQTGLPLDITISVLDGDWEKIKSYAQIEIIQRLVQEVLSSELLS